MKKITEKFNSIPVGMKSTIAFAVASFISTGISYLTTPIFTRLLSVEEYGHVNVFLTWQSLFVIIALFSLNYGVFNNGMMDYKNDRDRYSFSLLVLSNVITAIFGLALIAISAINPEILGIEFKYVLLMISVFFVQPAYNFWLARQRYEYKYMPALRASLVIGIIAPIISILCVYIFKHRRVEARIFGLEITLILIYAFFYILLGRNARWKIHKPYWKEAFLFNLPLLPHYLSTYLLSSSDKLMISRLVGDYATGYYSVAYAVASLGLIIWTAINGSLIPYTYEKCKKKEYQDLASIINRILAVILIISVLVILIAPEVLSFLASNTYTDCLIVIPVIVGGVFFQVHYSLYANVLFYYRKPQCVMFSSVTATIINLITNFIFIQRYGYIAAGYTTLFCYLIQAALDYITMRIVVKDKIYDMKTIGVMSLIIVIVSIFGKKIYQLNWARYFIVGLTLAGIFIFRNKILSTVKEMGNK